MGIPGGGVWTYLAKIWPMSRPRLTPKRRAIFIAFPEIPVLRVGLRLVWPQIASS